MLSLPLFLRDILGQGTWEGGVVARLCVVSCLHTGHYRGGTGVVPSSPARLCRCGQEVSERKINYSSKLLSTLGTMGVVSPHRLASRGCCGRQSAGWSWLEQSLGVTRGQTGPPLPCPARWAGHCRESGPLPSAAPRACWGVLAFLTGGAAQEV